MSSKNTNPKKTDPKKSDQNKNNQNKNNQNKNSQNKNAHKGPVNNAPKTPDTPDASDSKVIPTTVKTIAGQIVEVAPKEPSHEEGDYREDNLEMRQLPLRKRMAIRKQRRQKEMEGMVRMQKVEYLLSYFKWPIIFITGGILILLLFWIAIKNSTKPVALSVAFINLPESTAVTEEVFNDYNSYTSPDGIKTENIGGFKLDTAVHFDLETYAQQYYDDTSDYSLTQFPILCTSDFYDILITDRKGLEFCSASNMILDPELVISGYTAEALRAYQANAKDSEGVEYFWAYDITNTDFAKQLGYTEKVYLAFPGQSDSNKENAERFLIYLFKLAE